MVTSQAFIGFSSPFSVSWRQRIIPWRPKAHLFYLLHSPEMIVLTQLRKPLDKVARLAVHA